MSRDVRGILNEVKRRNLYQQGTEWVEDEQALGRSLSRYRNRRLLVIMGTHATIGW